jgi:hypothetical protein
MLGYWQDLFSECPQSDDDPLVPSSIHTYELQNPSILAERRNSLSYLRTRLPFLSDPILISLLDESFWNSKQAYHLGELFLQDRQALDSDVESLPDVAVLANSYPNQNRSLISFALRQSGFDCDLARSYFENDALLEALKADFNSTRCAKSCPPIPPKRLIALPPTAQDWQPSGARSKQERRVLTVDLHGFTRADYREKVLEVLKEAEHRPGIEKVNFITGRGRHSKGEMPLLRPLVLELLQKQGIAAELMEKNPGIVQAFLNNESGRGIPVVMKPKDKALIKIDVALK